MGEMGEKLAWSQAEAVCDYVPTKNVGASFCSIQKNTVGEEAVACCWD